VVQDGFGAVKDGGDPRIAEAERLHAEARLGEAEALYRAALAERSDDAHALQLLADVLARTGRGDEARAVLERALALAPGSAAAWNDLGTLQFAGGDIASARRCFEKATALDPDLLVARINLGNALGRLGQADEAVAVLRRAIAWEPDSAEARDALASALRAAGEGAEAAQQYRWALELRPDFVEAACNLAALDLAAGRIEDALARFKDIAKALPDHVAALVGAGSAERALGQFDEASAWLARALALDPDAADAQLELGRVYALRSLVVRAELSFRAALARRPDHAESHAELGNALQMQGRYEDAVACYRRALELRPEFPEALNDLGCCLNNQGFHEAAAEALRRAMALRPGFAQAHTNLIFTLDMTPGRSAWDDYEEKKRWGETHAARIAPLPAPETIDRDPARRLRIGYVSADFRRHSAAYVIGAVLFNHDPREVEVFAYSNVTMRDDLTQAFASRVDRWYDVTGMNDEQVAALVRRDRIDILVDLSGHSAGHRLLVFAREPAPVQVTAWGYGLGTGIKAIDYIVMDSDVLPPYDTPPFVETPWLLPMSFGYRPPDGAPEPAPPPVAATGVFSFGCYSRATKINDRFLATVAEILARAPRTRLVIKDVGIDDPGTRRRIERALSGGGVATDRVTLLGRTPIEEHIKAYALVDLMLNPFPHGGGVSVLESLWMGVPVLAWPGDRAQGRNGMMMIKAAGLADFVVETEAAYVDRAVAAVGETAALAALRPRLRDAMRRTAVGDQVAFCRSVEAAYRGMWRKFCAGAVERRGGR